MAFTRLNIALFAPIPSANVKMAAAAKPGLFLNILPAVQEVLPGVGQPAASGAPFWNALWRERLREGLPFTSEQIPIIDFVERQLHRFFRSRTGAQEVA